MAQAYELVSWSKVAKPHEDILKSDFNLSSYAANLGDVDTDAEGCPKVYRDPLLFFRATFRTKALDELLRGVCDVLSGGGGNRVLQLRTPFGGGKTHTLIALLHLFRHRKALDGQGLVEGYANPGDVRVAVLPCIDLDATSGRTVDGVNIRTLWGELAWRVGGREAYEVVRESDQMRTNPGGDRIRQLLTSKPTIILLDEVLTYIEAALGVRVGDSNLGRQSLLFIQYLTEVVRGLPHVAMVYSLQRSIHEAVGDEGLLHTLEALVSRIDAKKEPVSGDEVLQVVQRRLFADLGDAAVREEVARMYATDVQRFLESNADTEAGRRAAADQAEVFRRRVLQSYPFHPDLLDLMYLRWGSLPSYQRTRGALQFLATVVGALWERHDLVAALIGPGDVPLDDGRVRNAFFSQVGERESMDPVLKADLTGSTARCRRVDELMGADVPAYRPLQLGTRLTRAIALYSFGAKQGEDRGVTRLDLLPAVQMPGLPADALDVALHHLRTTLLYIHDAGSRYRFEKRPNINKLLDEGTKKIHGEDVLSHIRKHFEGLLQKADGAVVWPADSSRAPDKKQRFQVVFLAPAHALTDRAQQETLARDWTEHCGPTKRQYKNAIAFAVPDPAKLEAARAATRLLLAARALVEDKSRHGLGPEDVSELQRREKQHNADLAAAVRQLYPTVLLPVAAPRDAADPIQLERFQIEGYQSLSGGVIEGVLRVLENWVFEDALPTKLVACAHLGEGDVGTRGHWISGPELVDQFFGSVLFPKLTALAGLKATVAKGVTQGHFAYVIGARVQDGALKVPSTASIQFRRSMPPEEVDLTDGAWLLSSTFAQQLLTASTAPEGGGTVVAVPTPPAGGGEGPRGGQGTLPLTGGGTVNVDAGKPKGPRHDVTLTFKASGPQLFRAFSALQVLSEWADQQFDAEVVIRAKGSKPLDQNHYETAVVMSLEEADIEVKGS